MQNRKKNGGRIYNTNKMKTTKRIDEKNERLLKCECTNAQRGNM